MKLTLQKIFLAVFALAVSVAAAVIGMYMVFLADMIFGYRLLFAAIFMFNPILTGFLISYMFKKPIPKEPKEPKESKWNNKRKDSGEETAAESSHTTPDISYTASTPAYNSPAASEPSAPQITASETPDTSFSASASSAGYDLPGSETFTGYSDTVNAMDVSGAEASKDSVKSKLKFWAKGGSDTGEN